MVGSKLEQRIIALFSDVRATYSILQISKELHTSYPHVYNKVQELLKLGVLTKVSVGPSHLCKLNLRNDLAIALLTINEINRRDKWLKSIAKGDELLSILKELKTKYKQLLALSSAHKIQIVVDNPRLIPTLTKSLAGLPAKFDYLTISQFLQLLPEHYPHTIIVGFEAYFELIKGIEHRLPSTLR